MNPIVIQTENLPQVCSDWLAERCELHICPVDSLRFNELLSQAHGLAIRTYTEVSEEMLNKASCLKVVGRAGAGVDNINLDICKEKNIIVVNTPEANSDSVVEFVLTTMLSGLRNLNKITGSLNQKEWNAVRDASLTAREFTETTLGIIGYGRIGSRLGRAARLLGFNVLYHDLVDINNTHGCEQVGIEELLFQSNVVSIHVDGRKDNKHLCDINVFRQMKKDALFINTARGFVVDAYALTDYLTHSPDARAVLDVHDPEPISQEYPLLHLPNVTLYPHIACKTNTASINMGWVVKDIHAVLCGKNPLFEVKA